MGLKLPAEGERQFIGSWTCRRPDFSVQFRRSSQELWQNDSEITHHSVLPHDSPRTDAQSATQFFPMILPGPMLCPRRRRGRPPLSPGRSASPCAPRLRRRKYYRNNTEKRRKGLDSRRLIEAVTVLGSRRFGAAGGLGEREDARAVPREPGWAEGRRLKHKARTQHCKNLVEHEDHISDSDDSASS